MRLALGGWKRLPLAVRAALLMVTGCLLFSVMGALVKLLGQRLDSFQIAFFRCFFGFLAILPLGTFERRATMRFSRPTFMAISCAARWVSRRWSGASTRRPDCR